jgi:NitT/TauT family transport system permease protein
MTGLRLAIPEAFTGAVIGEFLAANRGVGYLINSAATQLNMAASFAAILVLLLLVMVFDVAVSMLERNALRWRPRIKEGAVLA